MTIGERRFVPTQTVEDFIYNNSDMWSEGFDEVDREKAKEKMVELFAIYLDENY